jgi:hypothetical protein
VRDRAQFLLDNRDAGGQRLGWAVELDLAAIAPNRPAVAPVNAHHGREEGRFSRPVAAAEGVNRASFELKLAVAQRGDAAERFAQPCHLEQSDQFFPPSVRSCSIVLWRFFATWRPDLILVQYRLTNVKNGIDR